MCNSYKFKVFQNHFAPVVWMGHSNHCIYSSSEWAGDDQTCKCAAFWFYRLLLDIYKYSLQWKTPSQSPVRCPSEGNKGVVYWFVLPALLPLHFKGRNGYCSSVLDWGFKAEKCVFIFNTAFWEMVGKTLGHMRKTCTVMCTDTELGHTESIWFCIRKPQARAAV